MKRIQQLISNPHLLSISDKPIIKETLEEYPYFQSLRALYLLMLKKYEPFHFDAELQKNSIYFNAPDQLKAYLDTYIDRSKVIDRTPIDSTPPQTIDTTPSTEEKLSVPNEEIEIEQKTESIVENQEEYLENLKETGLEHLYLTEKQRLEELSLKDELTQEETQEPIEESDVELQEIAEEEDVEDSVITPTEPSTSHIDFDTIEPDTPYYRSLKMLGMLAMYKPEEDSEYENWKEKLLLAQSQTETQLENEPQPTTEIHEVVENKEEEIVEQEFDTTTALGIENTEDQLIETQVETEEEPVPVDVEEEICIENQSEIQNDPLNESVQEEHIEIDNTHQEETSIETENEEHNADNIDIQIDNTHQEETTIVSSNEDDNLEERSIQNQNIPVEENNEEKDQESLEIAKGEEIELQWELNPQEIEVDEKQVEISKEENVIDYQETEPSNEIIERQPIEVNPDELEYAYVSEEDYKYYHNLLDLGLYHLLPENIKGKALKIQKLQEDEAWKEEQEEKEKEEILPHRISVHDTLSFNEWLQLSNIKPYKKDYDTQIHKDKKDAIIEEFIKTNPKINPIKKEEAEIDSGVKTKEEISHLMTETLAELYVEQHKFSLAIRAYKILSLKYPEKSSYFAKKIEEVNSLKNL